MEKKKLLVMSTLLVTILLLGIGTVAYIRRGVEGTLTGSSGNLVLIVNEANAVQNESFSISLNRSEQEPYVIPDDSGTFNININSTGSSTDVEVTINVTRTNLPDNLKFYTDSSYTTEITTQTYKISHGTTMTKTIPVYWFWDGSVDDENDTLFMGKTISANISVTAQVAGQTFYDALLAQSYTLDTNVDFGSGSSSTNGAGLMMRDGTQNNEYPIVYYRGDVSDNNVIYADKCWLIVRTTETGGIKLVFNGPVVENQDGTESCTNYSGVGGVTANTSYTDVYVGNTTTKFNLNDNSPVYVGYMYNDNSTYFSTIKSNDNSDVNVTLLNNYQKFINAELMLAEPGSGTLDASGYNAHLSDNSIDSTTGRHVQNLKDSTIKGVVDDWYETNIKNMKAATLLEDTVWCNDRSVISDTYSIENYANHPIYAFHFAAFTRLHENAVKTPSLSCTRDMDKFTVDSANGNGDLDYPIGLLTADEINLAGHIFSNSSITYLKVSGDYWSLSPYIFDTGTATMFDVGADYHVACENAADFGGARPSIVLKNEATISGGNGSFSEPYLIEA